MKSITYLAMILLSAQLAEGWVYFKACGFDLDESGTVPSTPITITPPNLTGYWLKVGSVPLVTGWRAMQGMHCTTLNVSGVAHEIHIIGTPDEVLKKLRIK